MPFWGPWITPPVQTLTGSPAAPHFTGGSVTGIGDTGATDADALNGTNVGGVTTFLPSGGSNFFPVYDPTADISGVEASLWLISRAAVHGVEYLPTWPPNAIDIEYDPANTDDTTWVQWPITVQLNAFPIIAEFLDGSAGATPPSDAAELLKRMTAADYTVSGISATPATANNWFTPTQWAARSNVASFPVAGGSSSFALDTTDLDTGGYAVFGECLNYIANGVVPPVRLFGSIDFQISYTYQPRKYRFLLIDTGRPPLAHRQRRDGTATAGPQLAHVGTVGSRPPLAWRQNSP